MSLLVSRCFQTFLAIILLAAIFPTGVAGQLKVEVGDEVKVPFLRDWHDGVVVDIKGRRILVDYTWGGSNKQDVFDRKNVRKLYEYEGLDFGRIWESANGKFKIEASLFKLQGDDVVLIKPDLTEVKIPINKLSKKDVSYVSKFQKDFLMRVRRGEAPASTPILPEIQNFGGSFGAMSSTISNGSESFAPLSPIPSYMTEFKQAGTGFNLIRKQQKLIAIIPVGGPDQLVLMSFREKNAFNKGDLFQSQLYWVSLKKNKVVNFVSITHEDYAIDYNPRYKTLLTFNRKEEFFDNLDEPDNYTLWKLEPGSDKAQPLIRFAAPAMGWASSLFGKVVNDRIVVVKTDRHQYEAFDAAKKKSLYVLNSQSFFDAPIVISHDRQNLIVPEDGQVSVVDATTGKFRFTLPVNDRHVSGANINEAGTKLAAITERNVYVWDLQSGNKEPKVYPAPLMGSPFKSRVEWIDDDHILGESHSGRILYRLSLELPIWSYSMDVWQYFLNRDPNTNMVIDGKFFYVAEPNKWGGSIAVGAVDLPGPSVAEVTQNIDRDALSIVKPGTRVAIRLDNIGEADQIREWLLKKIDENEWVYDQDAEIVLLASMGVGPTQTVSYETFGADRQVKNVQFRPHFANLKLKKGDLIIWQTGTSTGPPSTVRIGRGRTMQSEVDKFQKPRMDFFKNVRIENEIIDPRYSRGFGKSVLGLRGIQVESTSPPGREDDPLAASQQADEDRRKAAEEEGKQGAEGDEQNGGEQNGAGQNGPGQNGGQRGRQSGRFPGR